MLSRKPVIVHISDIIETRPHGILAIITKTGLPAWLPRDKVNFFPGMVSMPEWLAKRVCHEESV